MNDVDKSRVLRRVNRWLFILGALFLLCAAVLTAINVLNDRKAEKASKEALFRLQEIIPGQTMLSGQDQDPGQEINSGWARNAGRGAEGQSGEGNPPEGRRDKDPEGGNAQYEGTFSESGLPSSGDTSLYGLPSGGQQSDGLESLHGAPMPSAEIDGRLYIGIISIPRLDLDLPVTSDWSYEKLKYTPCRFSGSVYEGNAVIAAHNNKSHFRRITELSQGDTVIFIDLAGNKFFYRVESSEVLHPDNTQELMSGGFELSLFTCTVAGNSRYTVRCVLEKIGLYGK